jgi:serine phosphatase RsbU (regulator of sigma subunit)
MYPMEQPTNLLVLSYAGADGPRTVPLDRDATTVGRLPDQDLVLHASYVSRRHAVIRRDHGSYELVDQGSTHGTYLNGSRVSQALLRPGDVLQFGSPRALKVRFQAGTAEAGVSLAADLLSAVSNFSSRREGETTNARQMEQLNFLLTAARTLNAGGVRSEILQALLQLSIQLTEVERGFVFLREKDEMRLALGLRSDGTTIEEDSTVSRRAIDHAVRNRSPFYVGDTRADMEAAGWDSIQAHSIRTVYCIPLRKRTTAAQSDGLLGLLYLDSQEVRCGLNSVDHELLGVLATDAGNLLDNILLAEAEVKARRAAEDLAIAASIHAGLMAFALPKLSFARITAASIPCGEIGGDFYDAIALDDGLEVIVADVSGKGIPASIVAATLQGIIHGQVLTGQALDQIAALLNRFLCSRSVGKYATMVLLKLYPDGRVDYINCGQIPPLVITGTGVRRLGEVNHVVGLLPDVTYTAASDRIPAGARILIATDGMTEAENSAEQQFGMERLEAAAQEAFDGIIASVSDFQQGNPALDDCTLLEIQYFGSPERS